MDYITKRSIGKLYGDFRLGPMSIFYLIFFWTSCHLPNTCLIATCLTSNLGLGFSDLAGVMEQYNHFLDSHFQQWEKRCCNQALSHFIWKLINRHWDQINFDSTSESSHTTHPSIILIAHKWHNTFIHLKIIFHFNPWPFFDTSCLKQNISHQKPIFLRSFFKDMQLL